MGWWCQSDAIIKGISSHFTGFLHEYSEFIEERLIVGWSWKCHDWICSLVTHGGTLHVMSARWVLWWICDMSVADWLKISVTQAFFMDWWYLQLAYYWFIIWLANSSIPSIKSLNLSTSTRPQAGKKRSLASKFACQAAIFPYFSCLKVLKDKIRSSTWML